MSSPIDNEQASLALTQFLPTAGVYPARDGESSEGLGAYITLGSLRTFAGNFPIGESATAEGQLLPINQNTALHSLLGTRYGGDGAHTFALPNLAGRTAIGAGQGPGLPSLGEGQQIGSATVSLSTAQLPSGIGGGGQPYDNYQPSLALKYLIDVVGVLPSEAVGTTGVGFVGAVVPFAGSFVPSGYLEAAGQMLLIAEYEHLFSVIGTSFGGDGDTTFALPDLRGRTVTGSLTPGDVAGQPFVTVREENLPVQAGGSGVALENREPSLGLTYLISLGGDYPRNERTPDSFSPDPDKQYLGEVIAFAGNYAPAGWALAQGQILEISEHYPFFALLDNRYGGDGIHTFALPDLNNRTVVGTGAGVSAGDRFGSNLLFLSEGNISDPAPGLASSVSGTSSDDRLEGGSTPTTSQFINLAHLAYSREYGTLPDGVMPFAPDGGPDPMQLEIREDGFYGAAFQTSSDQVIIAFEGTHLSALFDDPEFVLAQVAADLAIYRGQAPAAYDDALHFTGAVLAAAAERGIGAEDVFVTGHSLGGAQAEYVSARLGLAGETYGAPGLPAADVPAGPSPLTNYVEYGDPIGNYSARPENYLDGFLYNDQIQRYGAPSYIGLAAARLALEVAGAKFGPGSTPEQHREGLALLAGLAEEFHTLTTYARDLHVTLIDPSVPVPPTGQRVLADAADGTPAAADLGGLATLVPSGEAVTASWFA